MHQKRHTNKKQRPDTHAQIAKADWEKNMMKRTACETVAWLNSVVACPQPHTRESHHHAFSLLLIPSALGLMPIFSNTFFHHHYFSEARVVDSHVFKGILMVLVMDMQYF